MIRSRRLAASLALVGLGALAPAAQAQQTAPDFRWAKALPAGSRVRLNNVEGNVSVTAATGNQVEIIGHRTRGTADEVRVEVIETSSGIIACVVRRRDRCDEDGMHSRSRDWDDDDDRSRARMNLEVRVPRGLDVSAGSVSGDVAVSGVEGEVRASTVSGDVHVERVKASMLNASSVSGEVSVSADALTGNGKFSSVSGDISTNLAGLTGTGDLSFSSVSGDVRAELPREFDADLRMTTVSGRIDSSYPITLEGRTSSRRIEGRIGKGGRRMTVSTVSGDLSLRGRP